VLAEMKSAMREGARVFEELERNTVRLGGGRLLAALARIPTSLAEGHRRLADVASRIRKLALAP
jgi:hypothetical protein